MRNVSILSLALLCTACGGGSSSDTNEAPTPTTTTLTDPPDMTGMLDIHNQERALVGSIPLIWSEQLAEYAKSWADHLANTGCQLTHRTSAEDTLNTGENIAWYSNYGGAIQAIDSARPAQAWAAEKTDYTYATDTCAAGKPCGHYTQMVWSTTLNIGCARTVCSDNSQIWVCNYSPPGNYIGIKPY